MTMRQRAILEIIKARLTELQAELALKQYQVGAGKVSPSTAHNVLNGKDHRITTLVEIADSMDCDVKIEIVRRSA